MKRPMTFTLLILTFLVLFIGLETTFRSGPHILDSPFGKGAQKTKDSQKTFQEVHAKICQLTVENDFLIRGLVPVSTEQPDL